MRKEGGAELFVPMTFQSGDINHELKRQLSFNSKLSDALKGPQNQSARKLSLSSGQDFESAFKSKSNQPNDSVFRSFEMREWLKKQLEQAVLVEVKDVNEGYFQGILMCSFLKEVYETLNSEDAWESLRSIQMKLTGRPK